MNGVPVETRPGSDRMTHVRYVVLGTICLLAVVTYIHRIGFARALPKLALDPEQASYLTAVFLLAYGIFEVPLGWLGDRFGSRHVLTLIVLGWSVTTALVAVAPYVEGLWMLPLLLGLRFLFGMFQAGVFPLISRVVADWIPATERGTAQGLLWMATRFGGLTVPFLFGWLMTLAGGWQIPLVVLSLLGPLWCAAFWPWFRNRPEESRQVSAAEVALIGGGLKRSSSHPHLPWSTLFKSRNAVALCCMYGGGGFAANFYVTLLPNYLEHQRHLPDWQVNWLSGLPFAVGMVACLTGGMVSDWIIRRTGNRALGRRACGLTGAFFGMLGWLAVPFMHDTVSLGIVLCFIFACNDLNIGPAWAACADVGERYAGTLGGLMNMMGSFAGALGNLVAGYMFGLAKEPGCEAYQDYVFYIYACGFGVAAVSWFFINASQRLVEPSKAH